MKPVMRPIYGRAINTVPLFAKRFNGVRASRPGIRVPTSVPFASKHMKRLFALAKESMHSGTPPLIPSAAYAQSIELVRKGKFTELGEAYALHYLALTCAPSRNHRYVEFLTLGVQFLDDLKISPQLKQELRSWYAHLNEPSKAKCISEEQLLMVIAAIIARAVEFQGAKPVSLARVLYLLNMKFEAVE